MCANTLEKEMSKVSEEANFEKLNYYRHHNRTLRHVDKKRQPVSQEKVTEMLRHQDIIRLSIKEELNTYEEVYERDQFERGLLSYIEDLAFGDKKVLLKDIGLLDKS
jgi:excinuclease UvrABC nuclease subunit